MTDAYEPKLSCFDRDVATGEMEILQDNGLYRHLRFRFSSGGFRWFDIVTWPDRLVITGDCETFAFSRLEDMFEFFRSGGSRINPGYWQEKIIDGRDRAKSFDWDTFRDAAMACFGQATEDMEDQELRDEARQDLEGTLDDSDPDIYGAVDLIRTYSYRPGPCGTPAVFQFDDPEGYLSGEDWDYHYIWCCRAIVWAIGKHDESKEALAA
ncbi:hypothetical protein H0A66_02925 [Alcaligenaceae bacterium]|nr:hypothetical protein [Alcaligenaceae bacterium]